MDIFTHALFACSIGVSIPKIKKKYFLLLVFSALILDVGEIIIQLELANKYDVFFVVYDERTSDIKVADNKSVTYIYDILHSFVTPFLFLISSVFIFPKIKKVFIYVALGFVSHIFLDSFTHGKVWALKLLFPLSNYRYKFFAESIGNWWDWSPKINLIITQLPIYCTIVWIILVSYIIFCNLYKITRIKK